MAKVEIDKRGVKRYTENGHPHREDGPATIFPNGKKLWYTYNANTAPGRARTRILYANGMHSFKFASFYHSETGPAVNRPNGSKSWYHFGEEIWPRF